MCLNSLYNFNLYANKVLIEYFLLFARILLNLSTNINAISFFFLVEMVYERSKHVKLNQIAAMLLKSILHTYGRRLQILLLYILFILLFCSVVLTGRTRNLDKSRYLTLTFNLYRNPIYFYRIGENLDDNPFMRSVAHQYAATRKYVDKEVNIHSRRIPMETKIADFALKLNPSEVSFVNKYFIAGASFKKKYIVVWLNNKAFHTAPLSLNAVHNALLRYVLH